MLTLQALGESHALEMERVVREQQDTLQRLENGTYMYIHTLLMGIAIQSLDIEYLTNLCCEFLE